jgi:hypothetical protein
MDLPTLIEAIDAEISRLQQARNLLAVTNSTPTKRRRNVMSAEGAARISAAQKKRWAQRKKAALV